MAEASAKESLVIWLTGLPCSGKSTLGLGLAASLRSCGVPVEILDGDEFRNSLSSDLGFTPEDRREQARRVTYVSKLLIRNGILVIVPLISPYKDSRSLARRKLGRFIEVYVRCPLDECIRRDTKGMYKKALRGEMEDFTGISAPYDEPENPDVIVETDDWSVDECVDYILGTVRKLGYMDTILPLPSNYAAGPDFSDGPAILVSQPDAEHEV